MAPRVVVLGMLTKMPVPGVAWQTLHYLEGLRRLGCEAWYVETHGRTPSMFMAHEHDDGSARAAGFLESVLGRFGFGDRWAFHALHHDGRCFGRSRRELERLYGSAALLINLHGGTQPLPQLAASERLVYVETDPVALQVELADGVRATLDFLAPHCAFFTFAENLGAPDCGLPVDARFHLRPTRQPVVLDWWEGHAAPGDAFTTVGNWRQQWREVRLRGETYHWSKHLEFARFLGLPARTGARFELALSGFQDADRELLRAHGWAVREAVGLDVDGYRDFVCGSAAEFTAAKDQNVRLRSGWFSDRSATYLAAGRPVITQDTGFGCALPVGEGLFAVSDAEQAAEAVERVLAEPARQRRAAREIAHERFAHDVVLRPLLAHAGVSLGARRAARPVGGEPAAGTTTTLVPELPLDVVSRRPTMLAPATEAAALLAPVPARAGAADADASVSVVVVCHDGLPFTKLCLASLLERTPADVALEVVVVDNGSRDGTAEYLDRLAAAAPCVRVLRNAGNRGFPAAANQGLRAARGDALVLLNDDVVLPHGWLAPLLGAIGDPAVGLAGPTTNRIGTEAEVDCAYRTLAELDACAARRAREQRGERCDQRTAAMFCVALRREVFEHVGPLDEDFGVGLLEDDDYAQRVRAAGLRVVCAEDAFVHHFGEASFGALVRSGERDRLLRVNRTRFEAKHGAPWRPYARRTSSRYAQLTERIHALVDERVPPAATVLVVSRGDERLLALGGGRRAWHFPQEDDGAYAGRHPGDSLEAIAQLEALRARGGEFILFPATGLWWLDHYRELAQHLEASARAVVREPWTCVIYALGDREQGRLAAPAEPHAILAAGRHAAPAAAQAAR
jgi:GT2 family glycosyltransferase